MTKPKVALIGIGGFGSVHAETIARLAERGQLECVAFADTQVETNQESYQKLRACGASHFQDYVHMLNQHPDIDWVTISTPIHLHAPMSIDVLERGFHVLLEKPPAVTIQDIDAIIAAQERSGKWCGVHFQNTSGQGFRQLIQAIQAGKLGNIKSVTGVGMWKRTDDYYERNPWAGRLTIDGHYVLDGTINNPLAHLLNNCLIIAGNGNPQKSVPADVQAELYKGHDIAGEDTACVRIHTQNDVKVCYYTTLCHHRQDTPYIQIKGELGEAYWNYKQTLQFTDHNGNEHHYDFEKENFVQNMYRNYIDCLHSGRKELFSSIEDCRNFVLASNGAFESSQETYPIPGKYLHIKQEEGTVATMIQDIEGIIHRASTTGKLFSEIDVPWAVPTQRFEMQGYKRFNRFR